MSIELITGLPGSGKSLSAVDRMLTLRERDGSRPVYVLGVDGLKDGLATVITADDLAQWFEFPSGSIFIVDECQKYVPMRRSGDPPTWVRKLSEHRHLGIDFVFITQAPAFVDTYLRGLVDRHVHLVRKFGSGFCDRYEWPSCSMSPLSPGERKRATKKLWKFPKRCFDLYQSAELHTVKRRIPARFWLLLVCSVFVLAAVFTVPFIMHRFGRGAAAVGSGRVRASLLQAAPLAAPGSRVSYATPADYVKAYLPRVAAEPWSAPVYDQRTPVANPDLYCITYHRVIKGVDQDLCGCFTEQTTPYNVGSAELCRRYARDGVYNPFRPELSAQRSTSDSVPSMSAASVSSSPSSSPLAFPADSGSWPESSSAIHSPYVPPELSPAPDSIGGSSSGGGGVGAQPLR